ncbi:MAG: hypothetical protein L0Z62_41430 [Gemmataceae bacterium]|nr:hypothetical protein [Gemmataceae bacterium]
MSFFFCRFFPACALGLAAVVLVPVSGCGGARKVTVSGTVAYKGQKLSSGFLQFVGPEGAYSGSSIQADGSYIITDVVPGEVKVGVQPTPQGSGSSSSGDKPGADPKAVPVELPERFRDPEKSGVKYTITPDTRELHIDLK